MKGSKSFASIVLIWFDRHGRHDLPWQNATPYRVWVSEIMLQQTQVTTVIPYYKKFIKRFPTLKSLALAAQDEVLSHWSGLGYYARARNLHASAKIIHQQYHGRFPKTIDTLLQLPGIGRSTAGAILSLAMHMPATILDGNVKRVLARFHAVEGWPGKTDVYKRLWEISETHTPKKRCNDYNQAMMDLGSLICTRTKPKCLICPLSKTCKAHAVGEELNFPTPKAKATRPKKSTHLLLLQNAAGEVLLEKRPPVGIWGGLWSFPECPIGTNIEDWCQRYLQSRVLNHSPGKTILHQFSHFELEIKPILLQVKLTHSAVMESSPQIWYNTADPLPGGIAAPVAKLLETLKR